jgi:CHAT domain-containing protein/Flp pilus assembly protein TadD
MIGKKFLLFRGCQFFGQKKRKNRLRLKAKSCKLGKFFSYFFVQYFLLLLLITALLGTSVSPSLGKPVPNFLFSSTSLLQQGKAYYEAGRFAQAAQVLQQAVQEYQKQKDAKKLVIALSNLSLTYQQLGAWERAKQTMAESLNILGYQLQETEGQTSPFSHAKLKIHDLPLLARSLDILGRLQLATGQAEKAWKTWNNSAVIYKKLGDRNGVAQSQLNQAQALIESGFFRHAEATLLQVQQTLSSQPDSVEKAVTLRSLGDVFQLLGDLEQSRTFLLQSWEVAKRLQSSQQIAASLFSLGNNARKQQQIPQALEFYQQAIKQTSSPLLQLQAQLNCLSLLVEQGKSSQAETLLPQIQSLLEHLPPSRASIYARINFAQTLGRMNPTFSKASAQLLTIAFQQARDIDDKHSQAYALGSLGSLYEQTGQLAEAQNLTQQALILAQAHNAPDIAYRWQWQLGRILKAQGDLQGAIAAYDAAVQILQSLRNDLVAVNQNVQFNFRDNIEPVYRQSVQLLLQWQQKQPSEKILERTRQQIEALQLAELDNFFRQACLQGRRVLLDRIVDRENPTAAILYPIVLPQQLHVIVKIPKQPLQHYYTDISQAEVETTVTQLRQNLVNPAAIKAARIQSQKIYQWLIAPIEAKLSASGVNTLVFIPDEVLRDLPMSSLYDGKHYLIEKYATAVSPGLQLLDPKPLQHKQLHVLVAGLTKPPPTYSQEFSPLAAIATEIKNIAETGIPTTDLLDGEFTKKALKKKVNSASFNIVHLATHGQFSSRAEETFILAADGPINVNDFDQILRSQDEISTKAVQLLVLSACQTAAGDKHAALGLAGAAVRAGARSTLASLWQIDDESTAEFIGAFYRELKNSQITKAEAVRRAQLQLLKHPNYNAPGFWSAYVLIGNWL